MSDQRPWYDTAAGIGEHSKDLGKLHRLLTERRTAGYDRGERLEQWLILGRFTLDSVGNCGLTGIDNQGSPKNLFPDIPDLLTARQFGDFLDQKPGMKKCVVVITNDTAAPADIVCPECGLGWSVANCHDYQEYRDTEMPVMDEFVGLTVRQAESRLNELDNSKLMRCQPDTLIRSDRFVDQTPDLLNPGLMVNKHGWVGVRQGVTADDYQIQPGDQAYFNVWRFYHSACNRTRLERTKRYQFRDAFLQAGFEGVTMTAVKNEYCGCSLCAPWFLVETTMGIFRVGWRKRVINLDWSRTGGDFLRLFEAEDVTKGGDFIHCWGWDKLTEYLTKIRESVHQTAS